VSDAFPRLARSRRRGAIFAIFIALLIVFVLRPRNHQLHAEPAALADDLRTMRVAIDQYHAKHGHGPAKLDDLVRDGELRSIPVDPITKAADWRVTTEETVSTTEFTTAGKAPMISVIDVHSKAAGKDANGKAWADY
jgi:general secretion pathway protein G